VKNSCQVGSSKSKIGSLNSSSSGKRKVLLKEEKVLKNGRVS